LVVQDDARDAVAHGFGRAKQQFAIIAPIVLGVLDPDRVETALDRTGRFVGSQNALAGRHHCVCDLVEFNEVHGIPPSRIARAGSPRWNQTSWCSTAPANPRPPPAPCLPSIPGPRRRPSTRS